MKRIHAVVLVIGFLTIAGCASNDLASKPEESRGVVKQDSTFRPYVAGKVDITPDTTEYVEILAENESTVPDSVIAAMLEKARQHYVSAISAQEVGDSIRSSLQFEEAIAILNQLSYTPGVDENREFNDLSKAVIEDYEQYIAEIDSLSPASSIFALREKLNQITELADSTGKQGTTTIIPGTTIPLQINSLVEQNIRFFQGRGRSHMERWLSLAGRYFPMMKRIVKEEGLPEEIVFMAMPESGLNPMARSWAKAVGLWQFMKGTGRLYGLRGNFWYDERRDVEKATRAAARHLHDLYEDFGDWYLVLAAYDSGPGRVYKGIRRSGSTDFWEMRRKLPRETRNYVPQYIAVTVIGLNPAAYGFTGITPEPELAYERVTVDDCVDLSVLASCAGTDVGTMEELNPELVQWCTPPGMKGYSLRVPVGSSGTFRKKYAQVPDEQKRDMIVHKVHGGETLASIAKKYGIPAEVIRESNHLLSARKLAKGKLIVVPVPHGSSRYASLVEKSAGEEETRGTRVISRWTNHRAGGESRITRALAQARRHQPPDTKDKVRLSYAVKKGDTIGHIAEWYGVRAADIRNWNELPYGRSIRAGADLSIWVDKQDAARYKSIDDMTFAEKQALSPPAQQKAEQGEERQAKGSRYAVRKGDTLGKIAETFGVTAQQIRNWNGLHGSAIHVGQLLLIRTEPAPTAARQVASAPTVRKPGSEAEVLVYKVRRGDTLWEIARTHNVEPRDIKSWNDITRNKIYAGQELIIHPGGSDMKQ